MDLKEGLLKLHGSLRDQSITLLRCLVHNPGEHEKHRRPLAMLIKNIAGLLHRARTREARCLIVRQAKAQLARKLEFRQETATLLPTLEARLAELLGEDLSEILPLSEDDPSVTELAEWVTLSPEDEALIAELARVESVVVPDAPEISASDGPANSMAAEPNEAEMLSAAEQIADEIAAERVIDRKKSQDDLTDDHPLLAASKPVVAVAGQTGAPPTGSPKKNVPRTIPAEPTQRPPPRPLAAEGGAGRGASVASRPRTSPPQRLPPRPPAPPIVVATNGTSDAPTRTSPRKPAARQLAVEQQAVQGSPPSARTRAGGLAAAEQPPVQRAGPGADSAKDPAEPGGAGGRLVLKIRRRSSADAVPAGGEDPSKKRRL